MFECDPILSAHFSHEQHLSLVRCEHLTQFPFMTHFPFNLRD
jgi:hypothetical protein